MHITPKKIFLNMIFPFFGWYFWKRILQNPTRNARTLEKMLVAIYNDSNGILLYLLSSLGINTKDIPTERQIVSLGVFHVVKSLKS